MRSDLDKLGACHIRVIVTTCYIDSIFFFVAYYLFSYIVFHGVKFFIVKKENRLLSVFFCYTVIKLTFVGVIIKKRITITRFDGDLLSWTRKLCYKFSSHYNRRNFFYYCHFCRVCWNLSFLKLPARLYC